MTLLPICSLIRFNSINEDDEGPIMNVSVNPLFAMTMEMKKQLSAQLSDPADRSSDDASSITSGSRFPEGHDSNRAR